MSKLADNEKVFGPLRFAVISWRAFRLVLESHGDDSPWNTLTIHISKLIISVTLPPMIPPKCTKVKAIYWDDATIARLGRDWYWDQQEREYGFSVCDGHFIIYYGIQPGDSKLDQHWSCFLPWTQWKFVRFSLYQPDGTHFYTKLEGQGARGIEAFEEQQLAEEQVGKVHFAIRDFDGEPIIATTHVEEREWLFGTKWCKWLSWFCKPKIRRCLKIKFSSETGREKGSWKGGTIGHSTDILPDETPDQAFVRYCEQEHRSKSGPYRLELVGKL